MPRTKLKPIRLKPDFYEKVWGSRDLAPWFPRQSSKSGPKIGEAWFSAAPPLPILVKFLFTSEKLSVQVHPEGACGIGKTEMWHILRAEKGARIALGFKRPITPRRLRESATSGEIEKLLRWIPVKAGETYFTPAGTVHAIGAGITLCEIQQNSDITYRLYDYRRPRELHIDAALEVADLGIWRRVSVTKSADEWSRLARCPHFATELLQLRGDLRYTPHPERWELLICVEGRGRLSTTKFSAGDVWLVPAGAAPFRLKSEDPMRLLRTYVPD